MSVEPRLDPPPLHDIVPTPGLWRNGAFIRVWTAATISVFGRLVTRIALPFVAVLVLHAGPIEMAALRSVDLVAAVLVGFVAGVLAEAIGLRGAILLAPVAAMIGVILVWASPIRTIRTLEAAAT